MKISECSQGREFRASWKFWGKICLWIWSDSNNNSQDHCETFWKGIVDFFFPQEKPLPDWNITVAGGRLPVRVPSWQHWWGSRHGLCCTGRSSVKALMGISAPASSSSQTRNQWLPTDHPHWQRGRVAPCPASPKALDGMYLCHRISSCTVVSGIWYYQAEEASLEEHSDQS